MASTAVVKSTEHGVAAQAGGMAQSDGQMAFPFDETGQVIQMGPLFARGLVGQGLSIFLEEGQVELSQLFGQSQGLFVHVGLGVQEGLESSGVLGSLS